MRILNLIQGTDEWLDARKGRAGASSAKEIVTPTGKPSKSALGYMRKLARECVIDDPMGFDGNKFTEWGHSHESEARGLFESTTGLIVDQVGLCVSDYSPYLSCSPDGLIMNPAGEYFAGLEIKCPTVDNHVEYLMEGILPPTYAPQVHWSMAITGLKYWYFMSYFPNLKPLIILVEWNEYTDLIKASAEAFADEYAKERLKVIETITP